MSEAFTCALLSVVCLSFGGEKFCSAKRTSLREAEKEGVFGDPPDFLSLGGEPSVGRAVVYTGVVVNKDARGGADGCAGEAGGELEKEEEEEVVVGEEEGGGGVGGGGGGGGGTYREESVSQRAWMRVRESKMER